MFQYLLMFQKLSVEGLEQTYATIDALDIEKAEKMSGGIVIWCLNAAGCDIHRSYGMVCEVCQRIPLLAGLTGHDRPVA